MSEKKGTKISLRPIDALLGSEERDKQIEIKLSKLHGFMNHPFKVVDDEGNVIDTLTRYRKIIANMTE